MNHLSELPLSNSLIQNSLASLEKALVSFSEIVQVPISFYSPKGELLWEYNEKCKICTTNRAYSCPDSHCRHTLNSAMNIALGLGEDYIFVCDAGLVNLAYALTDNDKVHGYFIAGPITMGTNREKALAHFYSKISPETMDLPKLINITGNIRLFSPREITHLMTLYEGLFQIPEIGGLSALNLQKNKEQTTVVSKIIKMKKSNIAVNYPFESENTLLAAISAGDTAKCIRCLSKYVEDLMVFENGNLSIIKIRLLSLFTQLGKTSPASSEYDTLPGLEALNNATTFKELMTSTTEFVKTSTSNIAISLYSGKSEVVSKALLFIYSNYMNKISLTDIAKSIHVNSSYLSTLFKKEMNRTITAYLQEVRLEKAMKKLETSNLSITEISLACGFESSSYFSKVFKEKFGQSPRCYRGSRR